MNEQVISQKLGIDQISEYNESFMGMAIVNGLTADEVIYLLIARAACFERENALKMLQDENDDEHEEVNQQEIDDNLDLILLQSLIDERNDLLVLYVAELDNEARAAEITDSIIGMARKGGAV